MSGGRRARISTGMISPIGVTALVLESVDKDGKTAELVAQASIEVSSLREDVMRLILEKMGERVPEIEPNEPIVFATHTHRAPDSRPAPVLAEKLEELGVELHPEWTWWGLDLGIKTTPLDYAEFVAERVVDAVEQALKNRKPGGKLTGVVVNIACSAQTNEGGTLISADYWHETRNELRKRLGESLCVQPQIATAGDQSPHLLWGKAAEQRMWKITGRTQQEEIAVRIADAVTSVLPYMKDHIDSNPVLAHRVEQVELTRRRVTKEQFDGACKNFDRLLSQYTKMRREIEEEPERKQKAGWYNDITPVFWDLRRVYRRVIASYEQQNIEGKRR